MSESLLVFPIDMDGTHGFARHARQLGHTVIGASSAATGGKRFPVDELIHLPYVTEARFVECFYRAVNKYEIRMVHTLHEAVWSRLQVLLQEDGRQPSFKLCGVHPQRAGCSLFEPSLAWAEHILGEAFLYQEFAPPGGPRRAPLARARYANLHFNFTAIPGQTDCDKLLALCALARCLPTGDLVELGSLYGRSAYALAFLAYHHDLGALVCVDPWDLRKIAHQGEAAALLTATRSQLNFDRVFEAFLTGLGGFKNVAYIREIATVAAATYANLSRAREVRSPELKSCVPLTGQIALLHVDANHRYEEVRADLQQWVPHVKSGGWLLIDDYVWAFGDGPKRAGDELWAGGKFDLAFAASDTLFLRKR